MEEIARKLIFGSVCAPSALEISRQMGRKIVVQKAAVCHYIFSVSARLSYSSLERKWSYKNKRTWRNLEKCNEV